jgi:hypothetical protein
MIRTTPPKYSTLLNSNCLETGDVIVLESWLSVAQVEALYTNAMLAMRRLRQEMANTIQGQKLLEELEAELRTSPSSWVSWLGIHEVESGGHLAPRKDVDPHYLMATIDVYRMATASFVERSTWHRSQCRQSYEALNKAYETLANAVPYLMMKPLEQDDGTEVPFDWPAVT